MVLLASLLFLLMLTTIAVTGVSYTNMTPRMLANAELKTITFNQAQGMLNQVAALDMNQFVPNECSNKNIRDPFNPTPPPADATNEEKLEHICNPDTISATYRATNLTIPRSENASGYGKYIVEYYRIETSNEQSGISTSLAGNLYKALLGDESGTGISSSNTRDIVVGAENNSN